MGNKKENIDQLFSEKFSAFEGDTPHDAWLGVQNRLEYRAKKQRAVYWRWTSVAASLLLAFSLGYYFNDLNQDKHLPDDSRIDSKPIVNTAPELDILKDNQTQEENVSPQNPSELENGSKATTASTPNQSLPVASSSSNSRDDSNVSGERIKNTNVFKSDITSAETDILPNDLNSKNLHDQAFPKTNILEDDFIAIQENLESDSIPLIEKESEGIRDVEPLIAPIPSGINAIKSPRSKPKNSTFEIGLLAGPSLPFRNVNLEGAEAADGTASNNVNNETLNNSYAAGIQIAYKKNRMEYITGITINNWSQTSSNILLRGDIPINTITGNGNQIVGNTSYGNVTLNAADFANQVVPTTEVGQYFLLPNIIQQYQFIEIPFGVSYYIIDRKFQLKMQMGITTRILSSSNVQLEQPNGDLEAYNGLSPNAFSLQLNTGPSFAYRLTSRLKLQINPSLFYGLTPNTSTDGIKTYHHQFILFSGFSYRL